MSFYQNFGIFLGLFLLANGYPIDPKDVVGGNLGGAVVGVALVVAAAVALVACACCRERADGFKEFRNSTGSLTFTNALASELSIFPPGGRGPGADPPPQPPPPPLTKPASFSSAVPDITDWLADPDGNFPRQHLFYQRELGKGWFGKVVEGEARGVKVVVRILREDATPEERAFFLHEAKPFRELRHRNIATLFGRCLDHQPYLLLFHMYSNGDLKSFLVTNAASRGALNEQGICLRMMTDIAEGLNYMTRSGFIHTDLAARNCLVAPDLTVKIGDYGASIDLYKDEYYIVENVAIPIRWCAPETVHCTPTTIETKQVTACANVWSLGVVLWEVAEFGRLPYEALTDDQVIIRVFGGEQLRLAQPACPVNQYLYRVMWSCWRGAEERPGVAEVVAGLRASPASPQEEEFRRRWDAAKPNSLPLFDSQAHTPLHSPRHTQLAQRPRLAANAEFDSGVDLETRTTPDSCTTGTPTGSEDLLFQQKKSSPSLTNLQGSLEELSWVGVGGGGEEEEEKFARNVSEAISHLDETLAREATSSSSQQDSEEETWRGRILRGEFTEKVREKSKSVTDLMVLTHIESEGSETDSLPSLTRPGRGATFTSVGFGSEGNIRNAVLGQELQDRLRQLSIWKTNDPFLGLVASEQIKFKRKNVNSSVNNVFQLPVIKKDTSTSSHVPEIVVSEPVVAEIFKEPETNVNTEYLVENQPRKFVFVCNDSDMSSGSSSPNDSIHSNSDITQVTFVPANKIPKKSLETESSVILGSCEEYTLDYFKGLKTTFVPSEGFSDDDSEPPDRHNQFSDLESPSSGNGIAIFDEDTFSDQRKIGSDETSPSFLDGDLDSPVTGFDVTDPPLSQIENVNETVIFNSNKQNGDKCGTERIEPVSSSEDLLNRIHITEDEVMLTVKNEEPLQSLDKNTGEIDQNFFLCTKFPSVDCINNKLGKESQKNELEFANIQNIYLNNHQVLNERNVLQSRSIKKSVSDSGINKNSNLTEFKMNEIITEDLFTKPTYDTYFSIDSGHSSDRCSDQEHQLSDLKNRLEDVANFGEEFQLKRSEEEYGGKLHTPDDERSSDSGFRDKGSLSESVEDTCDEKYNLEDIDAELDDFNMKSSEKEDFKYYDHGADIEPDKTRPQTNLEGWFLHPQNIMTEDKENGWLSQSVEDEEKPQLSIDDEFVTAIRNELNEKLPCVNLLHKAEEESSPEQEKADSIAQFNYPAQLSPILEEQESNQSSLILDDNSPLFRLEAPKQEPDTFRQDIIKALEINETPKKEEIIVQDLEVGNEIVFTSEKFALEDDVLVIDTETNEVTLIESPKPQSHLAFVMPRKINENFKEESEGEDEDSVGVNSETYNLSSDNSPSTQGISLGSNSVSSPENGILSGFFLSPCSIRSDLFDSGPPSLPFDVGQSIEEVEEISLCKPNNEAVEIEQELVDVGILQKEEKASESPLSDQLINQLLSSSFSATRSLEKEVPTATKSSILFDSQTSPDEYLQLEGEQNSSLKGKYLQDGTELSGKERRDLFLELSQCASSPILSSFSMIVVGNKNTDQLEDKNLRNIPSAEDRRDLFLDLSKDVDTTSDKTGSLESGISEQKSLLDKTNLFLELTDEKEKDFQASKILPSPEDRKDVFLNNMSYDVCKKLTSPEENENPFLSLTENQEINQDDSEGHISVQDRRDLFLEISDFKEAGNLSHEGQSKNKFYFDIDKLETEEESEQTYSEFSVSEPTPLPDKITYVIQQSSKTSPLHTSEELVDVTDSLGFEDVDNTIVSEFSPKHWVPENNIEENDSESFSNSNAEDEEESNYFSTEIGIEKTDIALPSPEILDENDLIESDTEGDEIALFPGINRSDGTGFLTTALGLVNNLILPPVSTVFSEGTRETTNSSSSFPHPEFIAEDKHSYLQCGFENEFLNSQNVADDAERNLQSGNWSIDPVLTVSTLDCLSSRRNDEISSDKEDDHFEKPTVVDPFSELQITGKTNKSQSEILNLANGIFSQSIKNDEEICSCLPFTIINDNCIVQHSPSERFNGKPDEHDTQISSDIDSDRINLKPGKLDEEKTISFELPVDLEDVSLSKEVTKILAISEAVSESVPDTDTVAQITFVETINDGLDCQSLEKDEIGEELPVEERLAQESDICQSHIQNSTFSSSHNSLIQSTVSDVNSVIAERTTNPKANFAMPSPKTMDLVFPISNLKSEDNVHNYFSPETELILGTNSGIKGEYIENIFSVPEKESTKSEFPSPKRDNAENIKDTFLDLQGSDSKSPLSSASNILVPSNSNIFDLETVLSISLPITSDQKTVDITTFSNDSFLDIESFLSFPKTSDIENTKSDQTSFNKNAKRVMPISWESAEELTNQKIFEKDNAPVVQKFCDISLHNVTDKPDSCLSYKHICNQNDKSDLLSSHIALDSSQRNTVFENKNAVLWEPQSLEQVNTSSLSIKECADMQILYPSNEEKLFEDFLKDESDTIQKTPKTDNSITCDFTLKPEFILEGNKRFSKEDNKSACVDQKIISKKDSFRLPGLKMCTDVSSFLAESIPVGKEGDSMQKTKSLVNSKNYENIPNINLETTQIETKGKESQLQSNLQNMENQKTSEEIEEKKCLTKFRKLEGSNKPKGENVFGARKIKMPRFEIIPVLDETCPPTNRRPSSEEPPLVTVVEYNSDQTKWLRDLLMDMKNGSKSCSNNFKKESPLSNKDWPTVDELIPSASKSEDVENKQKQQITSTLALMSPDLSVSTDSSKSHSLLSSFSSTPTIDDKKFIEEKQPQKDKGRSESASSGQESGTSDNGPLPSPEEAEKGWRPTIGQLLEMVDQTEGEEMTTSFIEPDETGLYTPDWESDTSDEQSSSSSEFIWKPQESVVMERIEEEDENDSGSSSSGGEDGCSEGSRGEFLPSMWDSTALPAKSAIRSQNVKSDKKRVIFKKEKYQCVYEYPREPSDSEEEEPPSWQAPPLAALADWELGDTEFPVAVEGDSDSEDGRQPKLLDYNIYQLNYNIGSHFLVDEGEGYISGGGSEFFPGRGVAEVEGEWRPGASDPAPPATLGLLRPAPPAALGLLRHTKDQLRLELPSLRPDKGEASILDSGEASILDSGIDTSSAE